MTDDGSERFKASELKPSRFGIGLIIILTIVPLVGRWYWDVPVLALLVLANYMQMKYRDSFKR
jgi:hypothetical protein